MANMAQRVMALLKSPAAQRMDFHFGLIHVDAIGLNAIHDHIAKGEIQVGVVKPEDRDKIDAEAAYLDAKNALLFKRADYGADAFQNAAIVHECIHALHDFYGAASTLHPRGGSKFITKSENEAAAYVVSALYYQYETRRPLTDRNDTPIAVNATLIATRIMNQRGAFVSTAEARALRLAVALNRGYSFGVETLTDADGRPAKFPDRMAVERRR